MTDPRNDFYAFIDDVVRECENRGLSDIAENLEGAMGLGSSGLEIIHEILCIFVEQRHVLDEFVEPEHITWVINFVKTSLGMR